MTDMNATCPFYRGEKGNTVYCEAENKKFVDSKEKSTHKAKYCCDMEGMKKCPQYIYQMEKYKKEENKEDTTRYNRAKYLISWKRRRMKGKTVFSLH